jgi:hypothetical protein
MHKVEVENGMRWLNGMKWYAGNISMRWLLETCKHLFFVRVQQGSGDF